MERRNEACAQRVSKTGLKKKRGLEKFKVSPHEWGISSPELGLEHFFGKAVSCTFWRGSEVEERVASRSEGKWKSTKMACARKGVSWCAIDMRKALSGLAGSAIFTSAFLLLKNTLRVATEIIFGSLSFAPSYHSQLHSDAPPMELLPPFLWGMDPLFHVPLQLMICQVKKLTRIPDHEGMVLVLFATKNRNLVMLVNKFLVLFFST